MYRIENKEKYTERGARRRAIEYQAAVPWGNKEKIKLIYLKAKELEQEDGIPRHVDHIIPLNSSKCLWIT